MKRIFWNVDTQFDFMRPDGKLYIEGAEKIEPKLEQLTIYADSTDDQKVNTGDKHNKDSEELSAEPDFVSTFPEHCMEETMGVEYVPATSVRDSYKVDWTDETFDMEKLRGSKDITIYKDAFDVFAGNKHTESIVEALNPDEVIGYGVAGNVCLDFAVMGLVDRGYKVYVPTNAIEWLPNLPKEEVLQKWEDSGVKLTTVDDIISGAYRR